MTNRSRYLSSLTALSMLVVASCSDRSTEAPAQGSSRFASVSKPADSAAIGRFCDQGGSKAGEAPRKYQEPPLRPLANAAKGTPMPGKWRWVNVWATWCTPCIEEMGLLLRWKEALAKAGTEVQFDLLSIDATEDEDQLQRWTKKKLAGSIQWIRKEEDFGPWLASLGVDSAAAIPIHVLVDPKGDVRCIRLGAVHEQDFGAVRALLGAQG